MSNPRFILAGTQSGVGKTTISTGIMAALLKRKVSIQPFKVGPDYIDPAFHTFITGHKSRNLDSWMLDKDVILELFLRNSMGKDMAVIEGVMGLYDGCGSDKDNGSTAHIAKLLQAPVILIINGKGMSSSAAAQVMGYQIYDPEVDIKGVIINNVSGEKHYRLLKDCIERDTGIKCLGYLVPNPEIGLESRHLGLIPTMEVENLKEKVDAMAKMVETTIDIDGLIAIAENAVDIGLELPEVVNLQKGINIGIALDKAFHFYYEDNIELMRQMGGNIIFFSPLYDDCLPENLHGLYLGGGYPEVFAHELEQNSSMRSQIKEAIAIGLPTYAECGGFMYLTKGITTLEGSKHEMVGVFDCHSKMTGRLQRFGYVTVEIEGSCVIAKENRSVRAHEFHRSILEEEQESDYAYSVTKASDPSQRWQCGLKKWNALGAYGHIHFYGNKMIATDFIENCERYRDRSCVHD